MDRRRELRFEANQPTRVTILGAREVQMDAVITNLSGRGMRLLIDQPVSLDCALRVASNDMILLGEVCYCLREGGRYAVGVELEHAIYEVEELTRLIRGILGEADSSWTAPGRLESPQGTDAVVYGHDQDRQERE